METKSIYISMKIYNLVHYYKHQERIEKYFAKTPTANLDVDREYSDHGFFAEKVSRT